MIGDDDYYILLSLFVAITIYHYYSDTFAT